MSVDTAVVPARSAATALTPTLGQAARRWWFTAVVATVIVVVAIGGLAISGSVGAAAAFSPSGAQPSGARALASVLQQQGVTVQPVGRLADADASRPGSALLVNDADDLLSAAQWRALAASTDRLIVVAPKFTVLRALAPTVLQAGTPDGSTASAGCDLALARRAGEMSLTGATGALRLAATGKGRGAACFTDASGAAQFVRVPLTAGAGAGATITLLASAEPFENANIGVAGNAAVALNVLGARSRLVWFTPSALDAPAGAPDIAQLTPTWVTPLVLLLAAAFVAAAFWRGRRLGALVVERLPVVVRSRETVEGRARLYQRGGARLRAADALRIGAIGRMAPQLGLSRHSSVDDVVRAVAAATRAPVETVGATLLNADPESESALMTLSDDLARLEAAVAAATALTPGGSPGMPAGSGGSGTAPGFAAGSAPDSPPHPYPPSQGAPE